jgi:hypothetical protein
MRGLRASWSYTKLGKTHAGLTCADPAMTGMASISVTPVSHTDSHEEKFSLLDPQLNFLLPKPTITLQLLNNYTKKLNRA